MFASRLHGPNDIRLDEVDEPTVGVGDVKLRVAHNGICGTDLSFYRHGSFVDGPMPLGHEFSGTIVEVGERVDAARVGEQVCVAGMLYCGECPECLAGLTNLCTRTPGAIGCGAKDSGGLAEFVVAPAPIVIPLTPRLSLADGALVEPMAVAFNGVLRSGVEGGGSAVVVGAGPIGIGVLLGLRAIGVEKVLLVEPAPYRRSIAESLGGQVIDPTTDDVLAVVRNRTGGRGADAAFVCAGVQSSYLMSVPLVRPRGVVVQIATFEDAIPFRPLDIMANEIDVVGAKGYTPQLFERVVALMDQGAYPSDGWVEHIEWRTFVEDGFGPLSRGERMKLLVDVEL